MYYIYSMLSHPLIGQEKIKQQLQLQLNSSQVPHAQLFTGNLGRGGLALALDFAFQLLGVSETKSPEQQADLHFVFPVVKGEKSKNLVSVDVLPKYLDEQVAALMVEGFAGVMTKLTSQQGDYIGVDVDGPFKNDSYKY